MSKLLGRFIADNTVDDQNVRLPNNAYLRGRNNADSADIQILRVTTSDLVEFGVKPQSSIAPTANNDLVNKSYVDDVIAGIRDPKDAVRVASTANIDLTTGTLLTIDGISLSAGDRVLVKNQTTASENGIYEAAVGAWSRTTDADDDAEVTQGLSVDVIEGTVNGRTRWLLTTADPITVGSTNLTFVEIPNSASIVQFKTEEYTLNGTDISNGYVDLSNDAEDESIVVAGAGIPIQRPGADFTTSTVSTVTRITFAGDLAAELVAGDIIFATYSHF